MPSQMAPARRCARQPPMPHCRTAGQPRAKDALTAAGSLRYLAGVMTLRSRAMNRSPCTIMRKCAVERTPGRTRLSTMPVVMALVLGTFCATFAGMGCTVQVDGRQRSRRVFGPTATGQREGRHDRRTTPAVEPECREGTGRKGSREQEAATGSCGERKEGGTTAGRCRKAQRRLPRLSRRAHTFVRGPDSSLQRQREGRNSLHERFRPPPSA